MNELAAPLLCCLADQGGIFGIELITFRSRDHDLHAESSCRQCCTYGHSCREWLRMPGPGEHEPFSLHPSTKLLPEGQAVTQRLAGISPGRTDVDDRLGTVTGERREQRVLPSGSPTSSHLVGTHGNSVDQPSQHPGGVNDL